MSIEVSVVICTRNRSHILTRVVESLLKQSFPLERLEIIIVDNASTDDTPGILERIQNRTSTSIRYIREPRIGLSHARNAGASIANGKILAFIDDDALADSNWIEELVRVYKSDEDIVCTGGRTELIWETLRPKWLGCDLEGYLGCNHHLGEVSRQLSPGEYPFGGNFSIKRQVYEALPGGFCSDFGHVGEKIGAMEEIYLIVQLKQKGKIMYVPSAVVWHFIPQSRAKIKYLARRAFVNGAASTKLHQLQEPRTRVGLLRSMVANVVFLIQDLGRVVGCTLHDDLQTVATQLINAASRLGCLKQIIYMVFFT